MAYVTRRFNAAFTRTLQSSSEALCEVSDGFYSVRLLASCQTPKLEDQSWSAVHGFLFKIIAAILYIRRPTPPFEPRGCAMQW